MRAGRYDSALRRKARRMQRQGGCMVYVPAEELVKAGFSPDEPPPYYRTWGASDGRRGQVIVRLYRER